ncbi:MAG: hypothetical protein EU531_02750 [Promethearchaeota archaeon]|nr:MAG: hypothetical protein EU531_02750 [Candidatus Lokiarchaeota archaeon]
MNEIKGIIEDIGISALEHNIKIAALAVISSSGKLIHQTENFDLKNQVNSVLKVINGEKAMILNDIEFIIQGNPSDGMIGTNKAGMGYVIIIPFKGGLLIAYALPQAEPIKALTFLKSFIVRLDGKI